MDCELRIIKVGTSSFSWFQVLESGSKFSKGEVSRNICWMLKCGLPKVRYFLRCETKWLSFRVVVFPVLNLLGCNCISWNWTSTKSLLWSSSRLWYLMLVAWSVKSWCWWPRWLTIPSHFIEPWKQGRGSLTWIKVFRWTQESLIKT